MLKNLVSTKGNYLDKALFGVFAFVTFLLPLIFVKGTSEIFEFPKITFIYTVGGFGVVLAALKLAFSKFKLQKLTTVDKFVLGILASTILSTLFSMSTYTSFFGYYSRFNGGLLSVVLFTLLYFSIKYTVPENKRLLNFAMYSTVPVSLYAWYQRLGFDKTNWVEDSSARVFSSLGQPNWLAAYLCLLCFIPIANFLSERDQTKRWWFLAVSTLAYSAIWFTYSLSGYLGFFLGFFCYLVVNRQAVKLVKNRVFLLIILFAVISVLNPGVLGPKAVDAFKDVFKIFAGTTQKAFAADQTAESEKREFGDSTQIRLLIQQGAIKIPQHSLKNLLIGTGPETFPYAFLKFRPEELSLTSEWDFVFNKPHNYLLELIANLGILGFTAYFLFLRALLVSKALPGFVKAGVIALTVTDFFGWHTVSTSYYLYLLGAITYAEH